MSEPELLSEVLLGRSFSNMVALAPKRRKLALAVGHRKEEVPSIKTRCRYFISGFSCLVRFFRN